jgi:hypothetical protein
MSPTQTGKTGVIPIGGDPFTSGLYRKRRKPRVWNEVTAHCRIAAEPGEYFPVSRAGFNLHPIRRTAQAFREFHCVVQRRRIAKHPRVCDHPNEAAQDLIGQAERFISVYCFEKPSFVLAVTGCIFAMRIY